MTKSVLLLPGISLVCITLLVGCSKPEVVEPRHAVAIATAHPLATQAGFEILEAGGNAFDAAVAVSAALAVAEPYSSGIGGGGFWLLHRASDGLEIMVDGRERAPLAAHRDMYLDDDGNVVPHLSVDGALAAGIPGAPAALAHIAEHYGQLSLAESLAPAIRLARDGFEVEAHYRRMAGFRQDALLADDAAAAIFLAGDEVPETGTVIRQPDLAATLAAMAQRGHDGFYAGEIARKLVDGVQAAGGIWSLEDLAQYRAIERAPVRGTYHGFTVTSVPPPSSGGVALMTMLNILSRYELASLDRAERIHVIVEAMRRAYRDRAVFLGDADYVDVRVDELTGMRHADALADTISMAHATPSSALSPVAVGAEGEDTTHFSIIDSAGNRVAATLSINYPFGAATVPPGTGVLLNDEMDDFSAKPGEPNVYGLVGAEANAIAPGKRMLSSMSPTFVESEDSIAILGTPGGSRIISMVLLGMLEYMEGRAPETWVGRPRFHHQYLPDRIQFEPDTFDDALIKALEARGHTIQVLDRTWGNMQAILVKKASGEVSAASDPRGMGAAVVQGRE